MLKKSQLTESGHENTAIHINVDGKLTLGRLASEIALLLRGKRSPKYTPHMLCGKKVVVTNVQHLQCTTKYKSYFRHTGYAGGIREMTYDEALQKDPCFPLKMAVTRMLNKSKLRKLMLNNLYLFAADPLNLNGMKLEKIGV